MESFGGGGLAPIAGFEFFQNDFTLEIGEDLEQRSVGRQGAGFYSSPAAVWVRRASAPGSRMGAGFVSRGVRAGVGFPSPGAGVPWGS